MVVTAKDIFMPIYKLYSGLIDKWILGIIVIALISIIGVAIHHIFRRRK